MYKNGFDFFNRIQSPIQAVHQVIVSGVYLEVALEEQVVEGEVDELEGGGDVVEGGVEEEDLLVEGVKLLKGQVQVKLQEGEVQVKVQEVEVQKVKQGVVL
jgi:hypothetical protein